MQKRHILYLVLACIILVVGSWAYKYYTASARGAITAHEQLESANSRIQKYNHFFDLCTTVQRQKAQLNAQKSRLKMEPDTKVQSRIRTNIAAIQAQVAGSVAQYNNDSAKSYTAARFKASNLPASLSTEGNTQCVISY